MQGAQMVGRAYQIGFLFFFFVLLRDLRGCNEVQRSRWTFYEVVKLISPEVVTMLMDYINAALRHAKYEILPDDRTYYGEITECNGVYTNADTLEACREQLQEVLEDWILFRTYKNLSLPAIDGIALTIKEVA